MSTSQERQSFDPEAEQEIDFARYVRLLAARWWLIVAGLILGAVIGYAVSLGGSQRYQATATLYLGQPYSASGNVQLQAAQTNPSTVRQIVRAESTIRKVSADTALKPGVLRSGISTAAVAGFKLDVPKAGGVDTATVKLEAGTYTLYCDIPGHRQAGANQKIENFRREIVVDEKQEVLINKSLQTGGLSTSDQLLLQLRLATVQTDRLNVTQLLSQAKQVEAPSILTSAAPNRITARSHRNTAVVAAIIGAIIGALAALLWDGVAAAAQRRRSNNG